MDSLLPIPENLMTGEVKDKMQGKIRENGGKRWSEHTRVLPDLKEGDFFYKCRILKAGPR